MGKRRIIAETGAGQHGVATATVCALFGFECVVYMGEEDMRRQRLNVFRMRLLGAKVVGVTTGSRTLKDAISEAMRDWVTNVADTHYLLGSALGAHPYPMMVRDFHKVIGEEARRADSGGRGAAAGCHDRLRGRRVSNAIGIFHAFLADAAVELIGVEAGGRGEALGEHAARFRGGAPGVLQGAYSYVLQDEDGQIALHAFGFGGAGLRHDRAGARLAARPEPRASMWRRRDAEALEAARLLSPHRRHHSGARIGARGGRGDAARAGGAGTRFFIVNLSGRGDKDIDIYRENFQELDQA